MLPPHPPVREQSGFFRGPLSLLSVRWRLPRAAHARSASLSPGPPAVRGGAGRGRFAQLPAAGPLRTVRGASGM